MEITDLSFDGYERVVRAVDEASGLRAFISVHDTTLGPALGGMRIWDYASDDDAIFDVLRLSKGMTYKSAIARTGLGGGKSVIVGDAKKIKSEALFLAMGRFIDSLGGSYITAEDVNSTVPDMEIVRRATKNVSGLSREDNGSGNPSPYTAYGVYLGLRAACGWKFGDDNLKGKRVVVQGVGAVGSGLCERLRKDGADVFVADPNTARVEKLVSEIGVVAIEGGDDELFGFDCDVFAPCALGAIINDDTIGKLKCNVIAGAANNCLLHERHGRELFERDILYAPDYVINSGGIVNVSVEFDPGGYDEKVALGKIERIPQALKEIWAISRDEKIPSSDAADRLAQAIVDDAKKAKA